VTLQSVSDPVELLTPGTPQNRALEWLIEDDKLCVCPDEFLACRINSIVPKFVQRYVMAVFYFSTGGGNWTECNAPDDVCNTTQVDEANALCTVLGDGPDVFNFDIVQDTDAWLTPSDECLWGGNACRNDTFCMDRIEFEGNGLGGTLPFEIQELSDLRYLIVEEGATAGQIPSEYGTFGTLHILDLNFNALTGTVPLEVWTIPLLFQLDLNDNFLTGTIATEIGTVQFLQFVQLEVNQFTGTIPTEMGNNGFLRVVEFFGTDLTGTMPQELCDLRNTTATGNIFRLTADCDIDDNPRVDCDVPECCTDCPDPV